MARSGIKHDALSHQVQTQIEIATIITHCTFCGSHPEYYECWANQIRIMDWLDDRHIEMVAEGRPHWIPSMNDFERVARDCGDDLVKRI